jgi:hypothetical protein
MSESEDGLGGAGERGQTGGGAGLDEPEGQAGTGLGGYARAQARSRLDGLSGQVRRRAGEAKERATERADEMTAKAGTRLTGVARALRRAGDELRTGGDERLASLTEDFAGQVEKMGSYLEHENPGRMMADLERLARQNPAFFVGGTFAAGLLLGRFLRADEPRPDVDIVFEPEGDWTAEGIEAGADGDGSPGGLGPDVGLIEEGPYDIGGDRMREMTPDVENISAEHPSEPLPASARPAQETPVRTPIGGHESAGPGVRTGSSGAAALDAGSGGPAGGQGRSARSDGWRGSGPRSGEDER